MAKRSFALRWKRKYGILDKMRRLISPNAPTRYVTLRAYLSADKLNGRLPPFTGRRPRKPLPAIELIGRPLPRHADFEIAAESANP
jgi:hypothetical protein